MKIHNYLIQELLPNIHNLLEQLGVQVGGHGAFAHTEARQSVLKLDSRCVAEI